MSGHIMLVHMVGDGGMRPHLSRRTGLSTDWILAERAVVGLFRGRDPRDRWPPRIP